MDVVEAALAGSIEVCDDSSVKDETWTPKFARERQDSSEDESDGKSTSNKKKKAKQPKTTRDGKKRWYAQSFNRKWLEHPDLREWLLEDPTDKLSCLCRFCNMNIRNANKSALLRHSKAAVHITNMKCGGRTITPKAAKRYQRGVTQEMLNHPLLTAWIVPVPNDPTRAWCKCCGSYKAPDLDSLIMHSKTKRHQKNQEAGIVRHMVEMWDNAAPVVAAGELPDLSDGDAPAGFDAMDDDDDRYDDSDGASPPLKAGRILVTDSEAMRPRPRRPPTPVDCDFSRRITDAIGIGNRRVGFIGAGRIAQAIAQGVLDQNLVVPKNVYVSAPSQRNLLPWKRWKCRVVTSNGWVMQEADVIFLAVRSTVLKKLVSKLRPLPDNKPRLIISLVPGVTRQRLAEMFQHIHIKEDEAKRQTEEKDEEDRAQTEETAESLESSLHFIRAAPSMMCAIGSGFCAYCTDEDLPHALYLVLETMFSALGRCVKVDEDKMDIYTTIVTGCAAFTCQLVDAMVQGGVNQNLLWDDAFMAIANVVRGTAELMLRTNQEPSMLKKALGTPGTGTMAALGEFQRGGLEHHVLSAMELSSSKIQETTEKL